MGELARADVSTFSSESLLAVAYLIVFGSIVAFTAYTWLLAHVPASTAGTYAYVNPLVAVVLGAILLNEPITIRTLVATVVIVAAVVALVTGRQRITSAVTDPAPVRAHEDGPSERRPATSTD
jgi:drug/metabolite transporter (DMT)-like permease